jgi:alcohol dehydrogenase class IV
MAASPPPPPPPPPGSLSAGLGLPATPGPLVWEFATAGRIVFGAGTRKQLAAAARRLGSRALLVTGRHLANDAAWAALGIDIDLHASTRFIVEGEPTTNMVREGVRAYHDATCDLVIGIGGGSVLDAAKAIAALATNPGDPLDYLEVIGRGRPLAATPAPCVAVPTTAGTGSEVTRNAVLGSPEHRRKASLRHAAMLPRVAIIDPELTLTLPPAVTASTGLDALTQVIEPYVSNRATPMTDALCLEGIRRVARSLRFAASADRAPVAGLSTADTASSDADAASPREARPGVSRGAALLEARTDMSFASLLGGLALANAGLGVVHGFAAPIGGMFPAPHGAVCAALLPHGITTNLRALRAREPQHPAIDRYRLIAIAFTGDPNASADDGVAAIAALCDDLHIPPLRAYGLTDDHVPDLTREAQRASSMKANAIELTEDELRATLRAAL